MPRIPAEHTEGSSFTPRGRALWLVVFTLSWFPIGIGLIRRTHVLLNASWWQRIEVMAPSASALRVYWLITIPVTAIALALAAVLLLRRRPSAALLASVVFVTILALNAIELLLVVLVQRDFAIHIGAAMHIPPKEVGGFDTGIAESLGELVYKGACLSYLLLGRQVRETFGPLEWKRLLVKS